MASYSEIALVDDTKLDAAPTPKSAKKRARAGLSRKAEKRLNAQKKAKLESKSQAHGPDVIPVMKLRAVDIVGDSDGAAHPPNETEGVNGDAANDEEARALQMSASSGAETDGGAEIQSDTKTDADQADTIPGSALGIVMPTGEDGEPLVTDPELLELLEQLSSTIDTANTVLDAASGVPGEEGVGPVPQPDPSPQPESEPDDPPPLAAQFAVSPPAEAPGEPARFGFGVVANAAIAGLILAAGAAWLAYTNPWLLDSQPGAPAELEQIAAAPPVKDLSETAPIDKSPASVAAAPSPAPASFAPPDDDPVPMEAAAAPPAPLPAPSATRQIRVAPGQSVPLVIALPATPDQTEVSVMIQDVPKKAKLSAGKSLGAGNWLLDEAQLNELSLETADGLAPGDYQLEVIFVRSDGKVPETYKVSLKVQPAASKASASAVKLAPEPAGRDTAGAELKIVRAGVAVEVAAIAPDRATPAPQNLDSATETPKLPALSPREVKAILVRGGTLLNEGDIAGARLLLEYAAERGSKMAMVKLGESYDPKYLAKLGARGFQADNAQAAHWYSRAAAAQ